jgi:hypothetical protein
VSAALPRRARPWSRRGVLAAAVVVLLAALAAAAWAASRPAAVGTTIDGFPVGETITCDASQQCDDWVRLARGALDQRDPGHAAVVSSTVHGEDFQNTTVYPDQSVLRSRGVGFVIVVFRLTDGSERATGVICTPGGCSGTGTYPH